MCCPCTANIFMDDAMDFNARSEWMPNDFLTQLVAVVDEAARWVSPFGTCILLALPVLTLFG